MSAGGSLACAPASPSLPQVVASPDTAESGQKGVRVVELAPCIPRSYEVCGNALDDNCNGALEEGCGLLGGVVQFMISWDARRADVDLDVTEPEGELIEVGKISSSGLIKVRDCPGRHDECQGQNLENVFLDGAHAPVRGSYRVLVRLEALGGETVPVWVRLSSRIGGKSHAYELGFEREEQETALTFSL